MTVRLSPAEHAALDGAAAELGVETGGLLKAAALLGLAGAVAEVEAGRLRVRRRSSPRSPAEGRVAVALEVREAVRAHRAAGAPVAGDVGRSGVEAAVAARRAAGLL